MAERVLIVDDDVDVRAALAMVLQASGLSTLEAGDGEEALERARETVSSLDLILLDMRMPRRSGGEVLEALEHERALSQIPVLVLSGDESSRDEAEQHGVVCIRKPVDVDELLGAIHRLLR